ncbi:vitamin B6 photo-protection and homoeostasis-domain-containing protein [Scenedesmus sp. NREL 46B-D3]|nr:vitamin B6 photo-protection and homoeostasis-domain-containing protein [Scenedesmus sp. NREL 46B-D3]
MACQQQQQQQLTLHQQPKGSKKQQCRITFATISSLQPRPDASDVRQAQQALASTVMAGLQLAGLQQQQSGNHQQHKNHHQQQQQQHAPLARLHLPLPGLASGTSSSSGQQDNPHQEAARRFPFVGREQHSSSSSKPPPDRNKLRTRGSDENPASAPGMVCLETDAGGRQRVYNIRRGVDKHNGSDWEGFDMVEDPQTYQGRVLALVRSYLLPQGFPDSVAPQYATYMGWRGVQYFFGGAMSVFTTKCLLSSLGVAGRHSGEAAAAINWVLKDGAGRLGRFLFARWGRELDCELKQFRLAGDLLMEAGAALELSTIMAPHAFLPLACSANLAKNLAAVAASSTRAPIYRTFALQNNLADITAKGESVANLADILGTLAGILLSKGKLPMVPTFAVLSCGYLLASRKEVDSVELPYLNRARLAYTATKFLGSGTVPGVKEANKNEPLLPWGRYHQGRVVLGSRVEAACATPGDLHHAAGLYKHEKYILCFRSDTKKVHILLRQGAQPTDCLKAAFSAHVLLHMLDEEQIQAAPASIISSSPAADAGSLVAASSSASSSSSTAALAAAADSSNSGRKGLRRLFGGRNQQPSGQAEAAAAAAAAAAPLTGADLVHATWKKLAIVLPWNSDPGSEYYHRLLERSKCAVDSLYSDFSRQADRQGWKLGQTMLNPKEARLLKLQLSV